MSGANGQAVISPEATDAAFRYRGRYLKCVVCGEPLWPRLEQDMPANADARAHRKCTRMR